MSGGCRSLRLDPHQRVAGMAVHRYRSAEHNQKSPTTMEVADGEEGAATGDKYFTSLEVLRRLLPRLQDGRAPAEHGVPRRCHRPRRAAGRGTPARAALLLLFAWAGGLLDHRRRLEAAC